MSTNIVLPTLTQWTENHISAIINATKEQDLNNAIDAFLAKDATIVVNGVQISRAEFEKQLQIEKFDEAGAAISFVGAVQVPADKDKPFDAGSVGLFYNALISEAIRIRDAPVTSKITASINVFIEQDPSIPKPPPSGIHGFFDGRRVKSLNQVLVQAPVTEQDL